MPRKKGSVSTQNKSGIKTTKYIEQPKVIKTISCDEEQEMLIKKPYQCVTCGKRYATQKNNFAYSNHLYTMAIIISCQLVIIV